MSSPRIALALVVGLIAAGCSGSDDGVETSSPVTDGDETGVTPSMPETSQAPAPPAASGSGRLLVLDEDGAVVSMTPDGTEQIALSEAATLDLTITQPTWSPDAERVAWVETDRRGERVVHSVVIADADGVDRERVELALPPFYLFWSPTGSKLAHLGQGQGALELGTIELEEGSPVSTPLGTGTPFYFDWSPDGDRLVAHAGASQLDIVDLDGATAPLGLTPGAFQSPSWVGDRIVSVVVEGDLQQLVVSDPNGRNVDPLIELSGLTYVVASPGGDRAAIESVGGAVGADGVFAMARTSAPAESDLGVFVVDLESGESEQVSAAPALAFSWSPTGDRLAMMTIVPDSPPPAVQWQIWDGESLETGEIYSPSATMQANYLPFFDQYAQSMTTWSPDGTSLAYAGTGPDGSSGIWVADVGSLDEPRFVAEGSFTAWSPQ